MGVNLIPWLVSAQYCVRQGASAYLELWAFLLLLAGAAIITRSRSRALSRTFIAFAVLTGLQATSTFYGCSMVAPSEQGLGTDLPGGTYTILRCLGWEPFGTATGWIIFAAECIVAIVLFVLAINRWKRAGKVLGFIGSALLTIVACFSGFLLYFGFSWCTSSRLF